MNLPKIEVSKNIKFFSFDYQFDLIDIKKIGNDINHEVRIYETNGIKTLKVKSDNASDLLGFVKKEFFNLSFDQS